MSLYVKTWAILIHKDGSEHEYEVSSDLDWVSGGNGWKGYWDLTEPRVSAADCTLERALVTPLGELCILPGWSDRIACRLKDEADAACARIATNSDEVMRDELTELEVKERIERESVGDDS